MSYYYERPYTLEEIREKYGEEIYRRLKDDPVHRFRAETGIEVIHREPTKDEFNRIVRNFWAMPSDMIKKSNEFSKKIFGKSNGERIEEIERTYPEFDHEFKPGDKVVVRRGIRCIQSGKPGTIIERPEDCDDRTEIGRKLYYIKFDEERYGIMGFDALDIIRQEEINEDGECAPAGDTGAGSAPIGSVSSILTGGKPAYDYIKNGEPILSPGDFVMPGGYKGRTKKNKKRFPTNKQFEFDIIKRMNENTKVTLTINQIKSIVREAYADKLEAYYQKLNEVLPKEALEDALVDSNFKLKLPAFSISSNRARSWDDNNTDIEVYLHPQGNGIYQIYKKLGKFYIQKETYSQMAGYNPSGKPKVFDAETVDDLYKNIDFAKAILSIADSSKRAADKLAAKRNEEASFSSQKTTMYFNTYSAFLLFKMALSGQISDGKYENSKPSWHWRWLQRLDYVVDPNHEVGYVGPSHYMMYDTRIGLKDDRAIPAAWFGKIINYCIKKFGVKIDPNYVSALARPTYAVFKKKFLNGDEEITMDDFLEACKDCYVDEGHFKSAIDGSGFGDDFVEYVLEAMQSRIDYRATNPSFYYDEAEKAINNQLKPDASDIEEIEVED